MVATYDVAGFISIGVGAYQIACACVVAGMDSTGVGTYQGASGGARKGNIVDNLTATYLT